MIHHNISPAPPATPSAATRTPTKPLDASSTLVAALPVWLANDVLEASADFDDLELEELDARLADEEDWTLADEDRTLADEDWTLMDDASEDTLARTDDALETAEDTLRAAEDAPELALAVCALEMAYGDKERDVPAAHSEAWMAWASAMSAGQFVWRQASAAVWNALEEQTQVRSVLCVGLAWLSGRRRRTD